MVRCPLRCRSPPPCPLRPRWPVAPQSSSPLRASPQPPPTPQSSSPLRASPQPPPTAPAHPGVREYIEPKALMHIIGTTMDYVEDELSSEFVFHNPNAEAACGCGESFTTRKPDGTAEEGNS